MSLSDPILFEPDKHSDLIPQFTRIHIQCVLQDHVVATFLPPFDVDEHAVDQKVLSYWKSHADQIRKGTRFLIFPLAGDQVAGYVTVGLPSTPTIGFRGEVEKLLVDPTHRRKGIAKTLMLALEKEAKSRGRDLLMLDAIRGFPAEHMYLRLGYIKIGEIPDAVMLPDTGERRTEVLMYKDIR
ncbi:acetyltransferase-like protein 15 [Elsinoe australis]|uniref:Acetyltransferase-like protein 15 n=1 Tax=Elsinoe australis TaxID=40998 RepID=A0A4U7AXS5_9PEZI|nr:acetyltransferase-like protein 15 [Elsinoe australis]